jgi:hypothetical protein
MKQTDSWCTPVWLADSLGEFDLDPCSNQWSHIKSARSFSMERGEDGLALPWEGSVWCNPPYSEPMAWAKRLREHNGPWAALVKLDTTTGWWWELMEQAGDWAPFRHRIRFEMGGQPGSSPSFANALVWRNWQPSDELRVHLWMRTS